MSNVSITFPVPVASRRWCYTEAEIACILRSSVCEAALPNVQQARREIDASITSADWALAHAHKHTATRVQ